MGSREPEGRGGALDGEGGEAGGWAEGAIWRRARRPPVSTLLRPPGTAPPAVVGGMPAPGPRGGRRRGSGRGRGSGGLGSALQLRASRLLAPDCRPGPRPLHSGQRLLLAARLLER